MNHNRSGKFWNGKAAGIIVRVLAVALVAFAISGIASAQNDWVNTLQFEGGIGVIPVTGVAANGAVNLNVVRGVPPAGPWRIAALEAAVETAVRDVHPEFSVTPAAEGARFELG